jgi:prolyl-tRNA editing enzyme YbaK/EbsC (Cys-tRNA(Pro) deacylase)
MLCHAPSRIGRQWAAEASGPLRTASLKVSSVRAMALFTLGGLIAVPASTRADLLAPSTWVALAAIELLDAVGVVEIDPAVSDTATTQEVFGLSMDTLANCVIVGGKREGMERIAACVVLATGRADVNNVVKRSLDVRKASFLPQDRAVELSGMEYGGITPIGLPENWPILIDRKVVDTEIVVIGSGVRRSKILLPGQVLSRLPGSRVIDGLSLTL